MQKIITLTLILFLTSITWAQKVQVLSGVTYPPKKVENKILIPAPSNLRIDDEMLPSSAILYVFQVCVIGKQEIWVSPEQSQPIGRDSKTAVNSNKIKSYKNITNCRDYIAANTPQDKRNMVYTALRELYVPNRVSYSVQPKSVYGQRSAAFFVGDKKPESYTLPYNEMVEGNILKKILTDPLKIEQFYSFNLPAARFLGLKMQERGDKHRPIRITFYEEMLPGGQARHFIVFVFNEGEKYAYTSNEPVSPSDTVYDITPDLAVQYIYNQKVF